MNQRRGNMINFSLVKKQEAIYKPARGFCKKVIIPVAAEIDQIVDPEEVFPKIL